MYIFFWRGPASFRVIQSARRRSSSNRGRFRKPIFSRLGLDEACGKGGGGGIVLVRTYHGQFLWEAKRGRGKGEKGTMYVVGGRPLKGEYFPQSRGFFFFRVFVGGRVLE